MPVFDIIPDIQQIYTAGRKHFFTGSPHNTQYYVYHAWQSKLISTMSICFTQIKTHVSGRVWTLPQKSFVNMQAAIFMLL